MFENPQLKIPLEFDGHAIRCRCLFRLERNGPALGLLCKIDTGATYTAIPYSLWYDAPWASEIDSSRYLKKTAGGVYGQTITARRVPVYITVIGKSIRGEVAVRSSQYGPCEADFLFDETHRQIQIQEYEIARQAREKLRESQIASHLPVSDPLKPLPEQHVLLGMGGGIYRLGGLCVDGTPGAAHALFVVR